MLPNSFVGETPPPSPLYIAPVGPVPATCQTGHTDQAPGQTSVMCWTHLHRLRQSLVRLLLAKPMRWRRIHPRIATTAGTSQGSRSYQGPIPNATQMMTHTHRLNSAPYASTSGSYQAENRFLPAPKNHFCSSVLNHFHNTFHVSLYQLNHFNTVFN